jgi:hypothetical protein
VPKSTSRKQKGVKWGTGEKRLFPFRLFAPAFLISLSPIHSTYQYG